MNKEPPDNPGLLVPDLFYMKEKLISVLFKPLFGGLLLPKVWHNLPKTMISTNFVASNLPVLSPTFISFFLSH